MWTRLPCDTSGLLISHALSPSWGRHADRPCIVATTAGWMSVPTADRRWPAKGRATWRTCAGGGELGSSPRRPPARRLGTSREIALSLAAGIAGRRLFQAELEADRLTPRRGKPELDDRYRVGPANATVPLIGILIALGYVGADFLLTC